MKAGNLPKEVESKLDAHWEMDFTEVKPGKDSYRYLLVLVDTFSGWAKIFSTEHEMTQMVIKKLVEDILPRHGVSAFLSSDNEPAFTAQVTQGMVKARGARLEIILCLLARKFRPGKKDE